MVKTPEKQNAKRKNHSAPLMNYPIALEEAEDKKMKSESSKSRFIVEIPVKPRTPQIKIPKSSSKLAELGFGHGKNHSTSLEKQTNLDDDDNEEEEEEEEEVKKTQIDENFRPSKMREYLKRKANQSASEKKNTIVDDKEEELEKRRNLNGEIRTPQAQIAGKSRTGSSTDGKKNTILDDNEWELKKMRSKRRNLDGKSRAPRAQIAGKSRFGYSIDGQKLPKHPQIEGLFEIIGDCSDPFEKKLLKTDVDRIILDRNDVKKGILPYLTEDEKSNLTKGGIPVNTYDEFGYYYEMKFESYHNCYYKLCNGWKRLWKRFYKSHELNGNEDCYAAVWMFRHKHTGGVCFAVTLTEVKVQDYR